MFTSTLFLYSVAAYGIAKNGLSTYMKGYLAQAWFMIKRDVETANYRTFEFLDWIQDL